MINIKKADSELASIINSEKKRKEESLELIPSENHTSPAVLEALSTVFNDKYAEGYPGARYYGGNQFVDEVENLCIERVKSLFGVPFANVQPYSGSPANMAVYMATINPGDRVLGMHLNAGGHLTHGWKVNFSGKYYDSFFYGVDKKTHLINYDEVMAIAVEKKPKLIFMGATAYPREIDFAKFREIADKIGAYLCADISHTAGLVAAKVYQSPVPFADIVTTTTHKTLRGPRGAVVMITEKGASNDPNLPEKINKAVFPGLQGGPHVHQIAAIAVCLKEAMSSDFKEYGKQIITNNKAMGEALLRRGFDLVTGGSDNHLLLLDLTRKNISGREAQELLEKVGIVVNKNAVPFDTNPPANPSGIRMGTPAVTTRGLKEKDVIRVATLIADALEDSSEKNIKIIREEVKAIGREFPLHYQ